MIVGGLDIVLVGVLAHELGIVLGIGLVGGLVGGLGIGLVVGAILLLPFDSTLRAGLSAYIRHQLLVGTLCRLRLIPPHYVDFLDFASEHVLLQRVGGGYRFVHALLLDYFADQWPEPVTRPVNYLPLTDDA